MKFLLISFASRNDVYSFSNILKRNNISIRIINTPKAVGSSCTLSIKTNFENFQHIAQLLNIYKPKSFQGVYSINNSNYGSQAIKLI